MFYPFKERWWFSSKVSHVLAGGHGIHGESQSETVKLSCYDDDIKISVWHRRRKGGREHTLSRLTHLWLRWLKWWSASWGCDPCSSDQSYIQLLVLHCQVRKTQNSVLQVYRNIVNWWGGRERIIWTLTSAQHDSIKLGAQHDSIKLGRIPILRHKASQVPLRMMNLGCIWFLHWFHHGCLRVAVNSTWLT
jgi:hypothetical protein